MEQINIIFCAIHFQKFLIFNSTNHLFLCIWLGHVHITFEQTPDTEKSTGVTSDERRGQEIGPQQPYLLGKTLFKYSLTTS